MAIEVSARRSRRSLLTAVGAAAAGAVAATFAGAQRVLAAGSDGQVLHVGDEVYDARTMLYIANNTNSNYVIAGQSTKGGIAISGVSDTNHGVVGKSTSLAGVDGFGSTFAGVRGRADTGDGVIGQALDTGVGVRAMARYGTALQVDGSATFERSGTLTIPPGTRVKTFSMNHHIRQASMFILALESNQPDLSIANHVRNLQDNKLTVRLSAAVGANKFARVNYLILN
jgi:hypothetical protein